MNKILIVLFLALAGCSQSPPVNRPEYALLASVACKNLGADLISWEIENVNLYRYSTFVKISIQCSDKIKVIVDYDPPAEPARSSV